jgi:hypothetical protein
VADGGRRVARREVAVAERHVLGRGLRAGRGRRRGEGGAGEQRGGGDGAEHLHGNSREQVKCGARAAGGGAVRPGSAAVKVEVP